MILFFHFICLLARYIVSNISKSIKGKLPSDEDDDFIKSKSSHFSKCKIECSKYPVYENNTLKFFPPVFVQRYETVALILQEYAMKGKIKKVVDFGCGELGFFMYLKNVKGVSEILEVDIDADILERYSFKAAPLTSDYLMGKGGKQLDVYILVGSIADYDDHLMGCDAVIGIELIEHLNEDAFDRMPYNVFNKIKPKLVIFTTPNADFNSLLPNFEGVRNKDHKFEWTRREFYNWTQSVLKQYPEYSVRFYGVGVGPEGTENLGCCSQMAVFQRSEDDEFFSTARKEPVNIHNYKLIKHYEYPYYTDTRTIEEKIVHEIQYHAAHFITLDTYYNFDCNESEIPLGLLKEYVTDLCSNDEELIFILKKNGMTLRKNNNAWYVVFSEPESEESDVSSMPNDWLNETATDTFYERNDMIVENNWSDEEVLHLENTGDFQSARSLEEFGSLLTERNKLNKAKKESIALSKDETKNTSQSCNQLVGHLKSPRKLITGHKNTSDPNRSRIPRKKNEQEKDFSVHVKGSSLSYVCQTSKKIFKSSSLDSCLEIIKDMPVEEETSFNFIPNSLSSFNQWLLPIRRHNSDFSLLSNSIEKAGDSGYPFSFSPPYEDLTPEQVDELFSENEYI